MNRPLVCLCLTGKTLAEDVAIATKYRQHIDAVELRVDYLDEDERLHIRDFPAMIDVPAILTIRRVIDGGLYQEGESSRSMLFARGLAFADEDPRRNFAYVDFEEDFHVTGLQDAALAFGTKIIRSFHDMNNPVTNLAERVAKMRTTGYEIPKIACMPHSLKEVTAMFKEASVLTDNNQILIAMGRFGLPTRILAGRMHSMLTYVSPSDLALNLQALGQVDPVTMCELYHFRSIDEKTALFGITGWPLKVTSSPQMHNMGFRREGLNAVYFPFCAETADEAFEFANTVGLRGFSVTIPHKETIIKHLDIVDDRVDAIGACNTVVKQSGLWNGYNTDCPGFASAIKEFTGLETLKGKKVAIIGAGGAARALAYAVHELKAKACVFNRTVSKAKALAELYDFDYAPLGLESVSKLRKYSDIIIQTTSKGMGSTDAPGADNDPLYFYDFKGTEMVSDIVYEPEVTPIMSRAQKAGCKTQNGIAMLRYQGIDQFNLYRNVCGDQN
ncbi:MAG: type I 3-dehydroquinate dehydratase [Treponema sp.]|nr:type I 3-dehydroquinate dehydratase [Treponema sp.]